MALALGFLQLCGPTGSVVLSPLKETEHPHARTHTESERERGKEGGTAWPSTTPRQAQGHIVWRLIFYCDHLSYNFKFMLERPKRKTRVKNYPNPAIRTRIAEFESIRDLIGRRWFGPHSIVYSSPLANSNSDIAKYRLSRNFFFAIPRIVNERLLRMCI